MQTTTEREWVEPRLAHLLGLEERPHSRARGPVRGVADVLRADRRGARLSWCFEDLQWADTALLEFIDHLVEWSRKGHPIFIAGA